VTWQKKKKKEGGVSVEKEAAFAPQARRVERGERGAGASFAEDVGKWQGLRESGTVVAILASSS